MKYWNGLALNYAIVQIHAKAMLNKLLQFATVVLFIRAINFHILECSLSAQNKNNLMKKLTFSMFKIKPASRLFFACCALALLIGCESTSPELDSSLIPEAQRKEYQLAMSKAKACPINLAELTDSRSSKDLLVGSRNVTEDTLYTLLQQSLEAMNVSPNNEAGNSVKIVLNRAFVKSLGSNMVATVVLDVMYKPRNANEFSPSATFRGQSVNVIEDSNHKDSNEIAIDAMQTAIIDATKRIKSSLLHNCGDALSELEHAV